MRRTQIEAENTALRRILRSESFTFYPIKFT
jgi:hypothetical protein